MLLQNNIFSIIWPTYLLLKCIGFASYKIHRNKETIHAVKDVFYNRIITLVLFIFLGFITLFHLQILVEFNHRDILLKLTWSFYMMCNLVTIVINIILNRVYINNTINLLNRLHKVELKITNSKIHLNYKNIRIISLIYVIVNIIIEFSTLISVSVVLPIFQEQSFKVVMTLFSFGFMGVLTSLSDGNTITIISIMHCMLVHINRHMKESFFNKTDFLPKESTRTNGIHLFFIQSVSRISAIHENLSEILKGFNKVVSVQILINIGTYFCVLTMQSFSLANSLFKETEVNISLVIFSTISILYCLMKILIFVIVCTMCEKEVNYSLRLRILCEFSIFRINGARKSCFTYHVMQRTSI